MQYHDILSDATVRRRRRYMTKFRGMLVMKSLAIAKIRIVSFGPKAEEKQ